MKSYNAMRWPTTDRVIVPGKIEDAPKPGDRVKVTGVEYEVVEVRHTAQFELIVKDVKP